MSSNNADVIKAIIDSTKQAKEEAQKPENKTKRVNVNWKLVILVVVYITSLFATALSEFVSSDLDWSYVGSNEYISKVLFNTVNNLFVMIAVFIFALDKILKNKDVQEIVKEIRDKCKKITASIFSLFMINFNRERRKKRLVKIMKNQLKTLDAKATQTDHVIWLRGTETEKEQSMYCVQRQDLLDRLDPKFVEEHIDEYEVIIKETSEAFVKHGYKKARSEDHDEYEVESGFWKFIKDLGPKLLLSIVLTISLSSIALEPSGDVQWTAAFIAIVLRLYPMATNTYLGLSYAKQYANEKTIVDLSMRNDILDLAIEYEKNFNEGKIKIEERPIVQHAVVVYKEVGANG